METGASNEVANVPKHATGPSQSRAGGFSTSKSARRKKFSDSIVRKVTFVCFSERAQLHFSLDITFY
jgi:hypothetical protein